MIVGIVAGGRPPALGVGNVLVLTCMAPVVFVTGTIAVDFSRATRARRRTGRVARCRPSAASSSAHNRRYGGFVVHLGILVVALGVTGSQAWSVQTETTLERGESAELAGYRSASTGSPRREESNHFKVTGTFTVANGHAPSTVLEPAKKFYPQEQTPIAYVDYRLGLVEDVYLVLGDFARDGSHGHRSRCRSTAWCRWIWIGGLVLTLGAALAILPERRRPA